MGRREEILRRLMGSRSDNVRNLLAARRRMLDQAVTPSGVTRAVRTVDGQLPRPAFPGMENSTLLRVAEGLALDTLAADAAKQMADDPRIMGHFMPMPSNTGPLGVVSYRPGMPDVRRHEVMHGYNQAAREGVPGMPLASRLAAKLPRDMAVPFDEMIATRAGGERIMDVPWGYYADRYRKQGNNQAARIAGALHAAQVAGRRGGQFVRKAAANPMATGAGLVGGSALLYGLMSGEDGQ